MSPWRPWLRLMSWCSAFNSNHCNSFEDKVPVDEICRCPISKRGSQRLNYITGYRSYSPRKSHQGDMSYWITSWKVWSILRLHKPEIGEQYVLWNMHAFCIALRCNRRVSQMRALLAACCELAVDYYTYRELLHVFEHKTSYIWIHITALSYFDTSVIYPQWFRSQICHNIRTFCIVAIFVKNCYPTDSWLL